jgi:anthranilate phosphoribosyltransferase
MTISPQEALTRCIEHREIFHDEMLHLMRLIMRGEMSPVMAAALTMGLRVKKETIGEIAAAATVMREFATKVDVPAEVSDHFVSRWPNRSKRSASASCSRPTTTRP